jgi:uncharacterized repeat protein (TIGR03803 family)
MQDGGSPAAGLVFSGSVLCGTAEFGGPALKGGVFAINTDGTGFTYLHTFAQGEFNGTPGYFTNRDGAAPVAALLLSSNVLYGTTELGGPFGAGALFAINTDGTGFTNLHFFQPFPAHNPVTNRDGGFPNAELVLAGHTLYGTAEIGGQAGAGTIFAINIDGTGFTNLHTFAWDTDGAMPYAGLTLSGNTLYGATSAGGSGGAGTVFSIGTNGEGFTVLHSFPALPKWPGPFTNSDGAIPKATLALSGNTLYGTASSGGAFGSGALFGINTDGSGFRNLYSFTALPPFGGGGAPPPTNNDGAYPLGELVVFNGNLYGTASQGGPSGEGTVFRLSLTRPNALTIAMTGAGVLLSWPTNAAVTLQACTNLSNPAWVRLSTGPAVDGRYHFSEPLQEGGSGRFYRLGPQ